MLIDSPIVTGSLVIEGDLHLPSGTTAQRPSGPLTGSLRFNTDSGSLELYNGTQWSAVTSEAAAASPYDIEYLLIAGGGGGGNGSGGGGGGAGGMLTGTFSSVANTTEITATVGAGGAGLSLGSSSGNHGITGQNSTIASSAFTTVTSSC